MSIRLTVDEELLLHIDERNDGHLSAADKRINGAIEVRFRVVVMQLLISAHAVAAGIAGGKVFR